jgi:hypothetical protein
VRAWREVLAISLIAGVPCGCVLACAVWLVEIFVRR